MTAAHALLSQDRLAHPGQARARCGGNLPGLDPERLLYLWLAAVALFVPRLLHAQAEPAGLSPGSYTALGVSVSGYHSGYGQQRLAGATVYLDGNLYRRLGFEAEARTLRLHADEHIRQSTYLAGIRASARGYNLRPYTKLLAGVGLMTFPWNDAHGRYFVVAPGAGLDYRVRHTALQVRLVDVEYQYWPQFTFGHLTSWGISSGLSVRLW